MSGKGIVQRPVRGNFIRGGSVELYRNILKIQCGNGGFHHSLINGLGGGSKIIALLLIKHHADRVRAFFQVELHRLTAAHFEVFCDGNRGQSLAAGINDVNAPCAFADGRVGEDIYFAAFQRNPFLAHAAHRTRGGFSVVLNAHIAGSEGCSIHDGIKNSGFNVGVIYRQIIVVNQLDAGGFLQRVFGGRAFGQRDRGIFKKAVIFLAAAPGNTDLLLAQADGGVGERNKLIAFSAFQRDPCLANAHSSAGGSRCVIHHSHIAQSEFGRRRFNNSCENGLFGGGNVRGAILTIAHRQADILLQGNRALQLGKLMNGECVRRSGNTHIINAVLVIGQRSVGVGGFDISSGFAFEALNGAPCLICNMLGVIADAFILPLGIGVSSFPQQGPCQNAVHRGSIAACGNEHLSSLGFNHRLFNHGLFSHGLFNHGLFNHRSFSHGLFSHRSFSHGLFNLGFFNLGFFNLGLVDHSLVDGSVSVTASGVASSVVSSANAVRHSDCAISITARKAARSLDNVRFFMFDSFSSVYLYHPAGGLAPVGWRTRIMRLCACKNDF